MGGPDSGAEEDVADEDGWDIVFQRYGRGIGMNGKKDTPDDDAYNATDETIYSA